MLEREPEMRNWLLLLLFQFQFHIHAIKMTPLSLQQLKLKLQLQVCPIALLEGNDACCSGSGWRGQRRGLEGAQVLLAGTAHTSKASAEDVRRFPLLIMLGLLTPKCIFCWHCVALRAGYACQRCRLRSVCQRCSQMGCSLSFAQDRKSTRLNSSH